MVAARLRDWVPRFTRNELIYYVGLLQELPENTDRWEDIHAYGINFSKGRTS